MDWAITLIAFIIGAAAGYIGRTLMVAKQTPAQTQLENTRFELEQQKQEISDYLAQSHEMLGEMTNQMNRFNQHWNENAKSILGEESDKQLLTFSADVGASNDEQELPPKDYVKGSQKIIEPQFAEK